MTDTRRNDTAPITRVEYEALLERIEDLEDSIALMNARDDLDVLIPHEVVVRMIDDVSPLRAWREYRGRSLREVAATVGIAPGYLSDIERGRKAGSFAVIVKLCKELDIPLSLLVDDGDADAAA